MISAIRKWRADHPDIYEFIMFNIMANIATITNFLILVIGNNLLFYKLADIPFSVGPFNYSVENGGLCGFLSFLFSYACAQTVNFIVQRKVVFHADNRLGLPVVIYILTVLVVYAICLYVPTLLLTPLAVVFGGFAIYIANMENILIQVIIIYPVMKLFIMKREK